MKSVGTFPYLVSLILFLHQWHESFARKISCGPAECQESTNAEIETTTTRETTKAIVAVMSVTILLIICLVVLLIILCVKKRSWESHDHEEASEPHPASRTSLAQIEENAVEVPSYISDRQMSLVSNYSGPPPYFSIFKIIIPETGELQSTCIGEVNVNSGLNCMTSVENVQESPPDYNGLFCHLPPAYDEVSSSNRKKSFENEGLSFGS